MISNWNEQKLILVSINEDIIILEVTQRNKSIPTLPGVILCTTVSTIQGCSFLTKNIVNSKHNNFKSIQYKVGYTFLMIK